MNRLAGLVVGALLFAALPRAASAAGCTVPEGVRFSSITLVLGGPPVSIPGTIARTGCPSINFYTRASASGDGMMCPLQPALNPTVAGNNKLLLHLDGTLSDSSGSGAINSVNWRWADINDGNGGIDCTDGIAAGVPAFAPGPVAGFGVGWAGSPSNNKCGGALDVYYNSNFTLKDKSFTIEMWVKKIYGATGLERVLFQDAPGNNSGNRDCLRISVLNGGAVFRLDCNGSDQEAALSSVKTNGTSTDIDDGNWHFLTFIYDSTSKTQKIFIDGTFDTQRGTGDHYKGESASGCISIDRDTCSGAAGSDNTGSNTGIAAGFNMDDVRVTYGAFNGDRVRSRYRGSSFFFEANNVIASGTPFPTGAFPNCTNGTNNWISYTVQAGVSGNPMFQDSGTNALHVRSFTVKENLCDTDTNVSMAQDVFEVPPTPVISTGTMIRGTTWLWWDWNAYNATVDPVRDTDGSGGSVVPYGTHNYSWAQDDDGGGRVFYTPTIDNGAQALQTRKDFLRGGFLPNTRHCLRIKAEYHDTGCTGNTVGPSADTPDVCGYTFANVPSAPTIGAGIDGTSVHVIVNRGTNGSPTLVNVEGDDGTGTFQQVAAYAAHDDAAPTSNDRSVVGLIKSRKYKFRSRAMNFDGFITTPSADTSVGPAPQYYVTQPATPANFRTTTPGVCAKTTIRWAWDTIVTGSGSNAQYTVRNSGGGATICSATNPTAFCDQTGITPSAGGTSVSAELFATDPGAGVSFPNSTVSSVLFGATAPKFIPQIGGLIGTSVTPGVQWDWTAPPSLCSPWQYQVVFMDTPGSVTLPADGAPQYLQIPMGPNVKSVIAVRAVDAVDGTGSPLSASATQYSNANPPTGLAATAVSTGTISVTWNANGNPNYTRYALGISLDGGVTISSRIALGDNFTGTSYNIGNLLAGRSYFITLQAFNGRHTEPSSNPTATINITVVTQTEAPVVSGSPVSSTQVNFTWTPVSNANQYQVYDATTNGLLATVAAAGPYLYSYTGGTPNLRLGVYVCAQNASGLPNCSSPAYAFTNPVTPGAPAWTAVSSHTVSLTWATGGNPNPGTLWEVNVATGQFFQIVVATRSSLGVSLTIPDLFPATTYYARVRAYSSSGGTSAFSTLATSTVTDPSPAVFVSSSPFSAYAPTGNIRGLWHFDDSLSSTTSDSSDFGNRAYLACVQTGCTSTPTFTAGIPTLSSAIAFSGQTHSLVFAPHGAQYNGGDLTVAAWVKPATQFLANDTGLVVKGLWGAEDFALSVFNGKYRFKAGALSVDSTTGLQPNTWQRVAGTYNSATGQLKIALDGVIQATQAGAGARTNNAQPVAIGNRSGPTGQYSLGFIGAIDEVAIRGEVWNAAEVSADYSGSFSSTLTLVGVGGGIQLYLPPNAFGQPARIYASRDPINHPLEVDIVTLMNGLAASPTGQLLVPNSLVEIVPAVRGVPYAAMLGSSATITIPYNDANGDGLLDGVNPPIAAHTLQVYTLDTSVSRWVALPSFVDKQARMVSGITPHFSIFAVYGAATIGTSLSQVRLYPNPWKRGSRDRYDAPVLTFDNLPQSGSIRLFTLSGERVNDLRFTGSNAGVLTWNGRNFADREVASGVYFALIKGDDGSTSIIKFGIER